MEHSAASPEDEWDWEALASVALREARRVLSTRQDAEDAAQNALIRAFRARSQCATPSTPQPWISAITRREAYRVHAARATRGEETLAEGSQALVVDNTENVLQRLAAQDAVAVIPAADRSLLVRRYVLEQSSREIAAQIGMPAATVRVRLHRAVKRIRGYATGDS